MALFCRRKTLITRGLRAPGTVTAVKRCWWIKINTKPVRTCSSDGAAYPHFVYFRFTAEGQSCTGRCYIPWNIPCPAPGDTVTVCFRQGAPANCTILL